MAEFITIKSDTSLPFVSRALAELSTIPPSQSVLQVTSPTGGVLSYTRDPAGTAISTVGDTWSPLGDSFCPEHFGANGAGLVSDSPAIQLLMEYMATKETARFYLNNAIYRMDERASVTINGNKDYTIDGNGGVILVDNADGGMQFTCTGRHAYMTVSDVHFAPALEYSGTAFEYTAPEGGVSQRQVFAMENCIGEPLDDTDLDSSFFNALIVTGVNRPRFVNNTFWRAKDTVLKPKAILDIDGCYKPYIVGGYYNGRADFSVTNVRAVDSEGFYMAGVTLNGGDVGLNITQPGRHPEIWVTDCHINSYVRGVSLNGVKYAWLVNNLMYVQDSVLTGAGYVDFYVENCDGITVTGNKYRSGSTETPARRHVSLVGSQSVRINEAGMYGRTSIAPYYIDATCQNVEINVPSAGASNNFATYPATIVQSLSTANISWQNHDGVTGFNDGSTSYPDWQLDRESASPAANDSLASVTYAGRNSAAEKVPYARTKASILDPLDGTEDGYFDTEIIINGVLTTVGRVLRATSTSQTTLFVGVRDGAEVYSMKRVGIGAVDSGGAGYRMLRIAN